jgi:hypothetical protein
MMAAENFGTHYYIQFLWIAYSILLLLINLLNVKFKSIKAKILLNLIVFMIDFFFIGQSYDVTPNKVKLFIFTCLVASLSRVPLEIIFSRLFKKKSEFPLPKSPLN